jgi:hypothetical protein
MVTRQISTVRWAIVVATFLLAAAVGPVPAEAQELFNLFGGGTIDVGDLTSTGNDGLQLTVEPSNPADAVWDWRLYPYGSTPTSPVQSSFSLLVGAPLTVFIPQLSHLPMLAEVSVSDTIVGNYITVNATMQYGFDVGNTFYGPQEYLLPIGGLDAGDYQLTLNVTRTIVDDDDDISPPTLETGFADFTVSPVPEPASLTLALVAISALCMVHWMVRSIITATP